MKQDEDWTGRDLRRSLGTDRRQGSKIVLVAVIESRVETERPESVLGPMAKLTKIALASLVFRDVIADTGRESARFVSPR